jgi:hypothetical protein
MTLASPSFSLKTNVSGHRSKKDKNDNNLLTGFSLIKRNINGHRVRKNMSTVA